MTTNADPIHTEQLTLPGFDSPTGWCYIGARGGFLKIGTSTMTNRRARQLGLKLLHTEPGGRERERQLHHRFRHARIDREWFMPTPDILYYITNGRDPWGQIPDAA